MLTDWLTYVLTTWLRCFIVDMPLVCSVGLLLLLPVSVPTDYIVHEGYTLPAPAFGGVALIALGFIGFCVAEYLVQRKENATRPSELEQSTSLGDEDVEPLLSSPSSD